MFHVKIRGDVMKDISYEKFDFEKELYNQAKNININLDKAKLEKFKVYKDLLISWNEKVNLTSITGDYDIIMKHFIDCLEVIKYIEENKSVIDIGTGAGFPGLVIAIYFDKKVNVTLMDALNKRINFLENVVENLGLSNVKIIHARAEEFGIKEEYREKYDYVVSRAVAPLNILLEYGIPFLKVNGKCLFLKGNKFEDEIKNSNNAFNVLDSKINNIHEYKYMVEKEEYNRYILEIIKNKSTNNKYPRNYGKIKKKPL